MAVDFRGHPMFQQTGFNAPTRFEADVYDCEVWGKVPTDIEGNRSFGGQAEPFGRQHADESLSGPILKFMNSPPR